MDDLTKIIAGGVISLVVGAFLVLFKDAGQKERENHSKLSNALEDIYNLFGDFDPDSLEEPVSPAAVNRLKALLPNSEEREFDALIGEFLSAHRRMLSAVTRDKALGTFHKETRDNALAARNNCRSAAAQISHWINRRHRRKN